MRIARNCGPAAARICGFSLIELMVAMVAGLVVAGAVLAFAVASMRSNADYVMSTRVTQDLRSTLDLVTRELRRSGYDEDSLGYVSSNSGSGFARLLLGAETATGSDLYGCVVFAYDRAGGSVVGGAPEPGNGEIRAFRHAVRELDGTNVGVVEYAISAAGVTPECDGASPDYAEYPASCNAASGWCALSDPRRLDITKFTIADRRTSVPASAPVVQVRELAVSMSGEPRGAAEFVRTFASTVRVRSDCYNATLANCDLTP
ncbi:MAG: prepilin-type N-terminal cleavage/methylation domain-containing protein [Luteimonas sp.]